MDMYSHLYRIHAPSEGDQTEVMSTYSPVWVWQDTDKGRDKGTVLIEGKYPDR